MFKGFKDVDSLSLLGSCFVFMRIFFDCGSLKNVLELSN